MLKAFRGVQGLQDIYDSYDKDTDRNVLKKLRNGKSTGCHCSKCLTLELVFRLAKGGRLEKADYNGIEADDRAALTQYLCLRALEEKNG